MLRDNWKLWPPTLFAREGEDDKAQTMARSATLEWHLPTLRRGRVAGRRTTVTAPKLSTIVSVCSQTLSMKKLVLGLIITEPLTQR